MGHYQLKKSRIQALNGKEGTFVPIKECATQDLKPTLLPEEVFVAGVNVLLHVQQTGIAKSGLSFHVLVLALSSKQNLLNPTQAWDVSLEIILVHRNKLIILNT